MKGFFIFKMKGVSLQQGETALLGFLNQGSSEGASCLTW